MMNLSRRHLLLGGIATAGLAACSGASPSPTQSATTLTLGLSYIPNVQFAAFYVAADRGLFAERGLNVTLRHHGAQEGIFTALLAGQEQILCASSDEGMVAMSEGQPVQTFATLYQRYPVCVIAPKAANISSFADLRGKKVGLAGQYGSGYFGLLSALASAGMTLSDISLQAIGYTSVSALMGGKVDAVMGFVNNEPIQFAAKGFDVTVLPVVSETAPNLVGPGLLTKKDAVKASDLRKVTEAVVAAEKLIAENPSIGVETAVKQVPDLAEASARANAEAVLKATIELWRDTSGQVSGATSSDAFGRMSALLASAKITASAVDPAAALAAS